jgi:hypothetical protein
MLQNKNTPVSTHQINLIIKNKMKKQIPKYIKSKTYLYYPISNNKKVGLSFFSDKELPEDKYEALILKDEILAYDGHHYSEIEEGYAWIKPEIYLEASEKFIPLFEKEIYIDDNESNENIEWVIIN